MRMIGEFHANGKLVKGLNSSFTALVPKKEESCTLGDYRQISMIGCAYKILSKLLASRLSKVLDKIISPYQSAFVGGRFILDGAVILNEAIVEAKRRKLKRAFFKIDFSKAFDSVDWEYLETMIRFFNFDGKWIRWMSECYSSACASCS